MKSLDDALTSAFGDYRAELRGATEFVKLFVPPPYMEALERLRPAMLVGGRGTGKTTALRALRFDNRSNYGRDDEFFGLYIILDKLRVGAFQGEWCDTATWRALFAHYLNLIVLTEGITLCEWIWATHSVELVNGVAVARIAKEIGGEANSLEALKLVVGNAINLLEAYINNAGRTAPPFRSMPERPVRTFATAVAKGPMPRAVVVCFDEYERLSSVQQSVCNTLVKQSDINLTYKVGMKLGGLKTRDTLDEQDPLLVPEDFAQLEIAAEGYEAFASAVANVRMQYARTLNIDVPRTPSEMLPAITPDEEVKELGGVRAIERVRARISDPILGAEFESLRMSHQVLVCYLIEAEIEDSLERAIRMALDETQQWLDRVNNYLTPSIFWLSRGRKGARLQKIFAGFPMLVRLSAGNIRYLLELVDESCREGLQYYRSGSFSVSPVAQTHAAQRVGRRRLEQIDAFAEHGVAVKRMVLALGQVFMELARRPGAPETNMFILKEETSVDSRDALVILNSAIASQAVITSMSTKATSEDQMKVPEYRLHPLFAVVFGFSHRRKRRIVIDPIDLKLLQDDPKSAIRKMLRDEPPQEEIPAQLGLYQDFFFSTSRKRD